MKKLAVVLWVLAGLAIIGGAVNGDSAGLASTITGAIILALLGLLAYRKSVKNEQKKKKQADRLNEIYMGSPVAMALLDISNGKLPVFNDSPIIRSGETTHLYCKAKRYITKNRVVGHTASTAGASFQVAKGMRVRTGGIQGSSMYDDVTTTYDGEFVLTNKRLMFISNQNGFESTLGTVSAITEAEDGRTIIQKGDVACVLNFIVAFDDNGESLIVRNGAASFLVKAIELIRKKYDETD